MTMMHNDRQPDEQERPQTAEGAPDFGAHRPAQPGAASDEATTAYPVTPAASAESGPASPFGGAQPEQPETGAASAATRPEPDWARAEALGAVRPPVAAAPATGAPSGAGRMSRLAVAGLFLLGTLGGGIAGSAATLAVTGAGQPGARVAQQTAQSPSSLQRTSTELPPAAKSNIGALVRDVGPSVVMVLTRETATPGIPRGTQGEGTGFIVDAQGLILTNNHVVEGAQRITIIFPDNSRTTAQVVGRDPQSDLAVLKADIPADKLVVAPLGDSDKVEVGEPVVAIGAPFGLNQTVTSGIVSATKRDWGQTGGGRPMRGLIQTDAPVNPGNSGGPLFNMNGEVIGITTAIESPVRGSVGIGFAIPINQAKKLLPQLSTGQNVEHPWLGISGIAITDDVVAEQKLPVKEGVLVAEVIADGPAQKAGLRGGKAADEGEIPSGGDIITAVDGKKVTTVQEIARYLDTLKVGDKVKLSVVRDGKAQEITVTLGAWQRPPNE